MRPVHRAKLKSLITVVIGLFVLFALLFVGGMADCGTIAPC